MDFICIMIYIKVHYNIFTLITIVILGKSMEKLNLIIIMSYISMMLLVGGQGEL